MAAPGMRIEGRHRFSTLSVCHVLLHPIALSLAVAFKSNLQSMTQRCKACLWPGLRTTKTGPASVISYLICTSTPVRRRGFGPNRPGVLTPSAQRSALDRASDCHGRPSLRSHREQESIATCFQQYLHASNRKRDHRSKSPPFSRFSTNGGPRLSIRAVNLIPLGWLRRFLRPSVRGSFDG
jgi:hypothetical protein